MPKYTNATQTLWDEQFTHEGKTYSVDALLDSSWLKHDGQDGDPPDIILRDFELVNIELNVRNADTSDFQSLGTFTDLSAVDSKLRPHLVALCMLKLQDVEFESWEEVDDE